MQNLLKPPPATDCCSPKQQPLQPLPIMAPLATADEPCCGPPAGPPSSPFEKPGYRLCRYVDGFIETAAGPVPRLKSRLDPYDQLGRLRARIGIARDAHRVAPGLYALGNPGKDSPVLVTANYKLTIDTLRQQAAGIDAWLLVLDTRGINVWCAAGKKTFSTDEVVHRVRLARLELVVNHRELVLPQLAAPGVSGHEVRKQCGFKVTWGPIRAGDIPAFLAAGKATGAMRKLSFTISERIVLTPVELYHFIKPSLWIIAGLFVLSGIGPEWFALDTALLRGSLALAAYATGIFAGAFVVPLLLPWLPGRAFFLKGISVGVLVGAVVIFGLLPPIRPLAAAALLLFATIISSYAAMNFTGSTPFTSPSGVEKEMRLGIPIQAATGLLAACLWIGDRFTG